MRTRLPAPALVVLVGPSSSGKSTWALEQFAPEEIVSSDSLRATVGSSAGDQSASQDAFALLDQIVDMRVRRGLTTVVDTLGFDADRRRQWIELAHEANVGAYAVVFSTAGEECLRRNEARPDGIPKTVLRKQLTRFREVETELEAEPFDGVFSEQPIAVVAPQFASAGPGTNAGPPSVSMREAPAKHTFGLVLNRFNWPGDPDQRADQLAHVARRAEDAGFRDLWVMDHFRQIPQVGRAWEDIPESYTTLAYLAACTSRIRLGTLVTGVTYRNPGHLGKIVATLDVLSGGRAVCGIGLGWDAEEHAGYGWDFPTVGERYAILEETLHLLPLMWGKGSPRFDGTVVRAEALTCYPRPIQEKIPILIGGSGENRTLRLVAEYGDACNVMGDPNRVKHKVEVLHSHCDVIGRDPSDIEVTHLTRAIAAADASTLRDRIDQLRARGQSREAYARVNNAGTVDELADLFGSYAVAGAHHSIVSLPDVHLEGSIETFARIIQSFEEP